MIKAILLLAVGGVVGYVVAKRPCCASCALGALTPHASAGADAAGAAGASSGKGDKGEGTPTGTASDKDTTASGTGTDAVKDLASRTDAKMTVRRAVLW